ncbi:MAG: ATP-binding protein [Oscillospiraceae bacterium]|nr:ATP-binding protein [Oscillospiraceae bacterium]
MSYNEDYFNIALAKLEERRRVNRLESDMRRSEVETKIPEYRTLSQKLGETGGKLVALIMRGGDTSAELAKLERENTETQKRLAELLYENGYPQDYLEPVYTCPICRDKGIVNNQWCSCFNKLLMEETARELNQNSPLKLSTFESFRVDLYPDVINPIMKVSERSIMQRNFDYCKSYAENFTPASEGILMTGATGLGKTHLSLAIASKVLEKGYTVIYGSAPELLHTLEREHFGKSSKDTMSALTGCDLLIFDDLGAETDKPLYDSLIYEIINSRICRSLPMIVSTNYNTTELQKHYADKICSRLLSFRLMAFFGNDIRRVLKKQR